MPGIFERVKPDQPSDDRISSNLMHACFILRASGDFTDIQIRDTLNADLSNPLAGDELTDLNAISSEMDLALLLSDKIVYATKLRAALILVEEGGIDEVKFRSILNI